MIVCAMLLANCVLAQNNSLTVVIKGVKNASGRVAVALYNSEKDFMKNRLTGKVTEASAGAVQVVFENIPAGDYAVSVMHDENQNDKLDSNLVGMPKEGFAFSNDATGMFGPPSFEKAKFSVSAPITIAMTMKYL